MNNKKGFNFEKALKNALEQYKRAREIKSLAENSNDVLAKVLLYENLMTFRIGVIFERINLLHMENLLRNTKKIYLFQLPNFESLMDSYTLGQVAKLAKSVLNQYPNLIKDITKFNKSRIQLTHKMFDVGKISSMDEILKIAKSLAILGDKIVDELEAINDEIDNMLKINRKNP